MEYPKLEQTTSSEYKINVLYLGNEKQAEAQLASALQQSIDALYVATDTFTGLERYKQHRPQLIIANVDIAELDAIGMCQAVRSCDTQTPIIMIADSERLAYLRAAIDLSATQLFIRPVDDAQLSQCVAKVAADFEEKQRLLSKLEVIKQVEKSDPYRASLSKILDGHIEDFKRHPVLLIEKDKDISNSIKKSLGKRVGQIYNAVNAEQALELFIEHTPSVVIANLDTLGEAGIHFIEQIRNIMPAVPIIFTNGKESIATPAELFELGQSTDQSNNEINAENIFKAITNNARLQHEQHHIELSASIFFYSALAMTIANRDGKIVSVNPAFCQITGYTQKEVLGRNPNILSSGKHDEQFYQNMWESINTTHHWSGEIWNKRKNGELFLEWITINAITNAQGEVSHYFSVFADITERKVAEEAIRKLTYHDALTELPNRRLFMDRIKQEIDNAKKSKQMMAVMFVDIDHLKDINDTLGHDHGDLVIREAAERLQDSVRETDTVARFGGDEFTICLTNLLSPDNANTIAHNILNAMAEPFLIADEKIHLSASIGIALYPNDAVTVSDLLKQADQAMFSAKYSGRNRVHYFQPSMHEYALARKTMIKDLRAALASSQFTVCYQPIVTLATHKIQKAEVLIRWQHPENGTISPANFIPVAEESGIISDIGNWTFQQAAVQAKHWQKKYQDNFQLSINTSPKQFQNDSDMYLNWLAFLNDITLPTDSVIVEITEGVLMDSNNTNTNQLLKFRDAGIQVALDDFGTGYSSLAYLKKFDIDYIKIDQTFVRNLVDSSDDQALCEAIIVMAHKLGLKVIAEGIETADQEQILKQAGCDYGQGYFFSKPLSAVEFEAMMLENGY